MTGEEKELALYCLKASSDYHSEVCEECINYPNCDHTIQDDVTETIIKALEQEPKTGNWIAQDIHNCHTDFKCSECGYIHSFMHLYGKPTADYTYCPNCGARMESAEC